MAIETGGLPRVPFGGAASPHSVDADGRDDSISNAANSALTRRVLLRTGVTFAIGTILTQLAHGSQENMVMTAASISGARDFDFLHGNWRVSHQRLAQRLRSSTDWVRFGGTMTAKPILGGLGNFDENVIELPQGTYQACTVRLFNPEQLRWSIYWIDGRDAKLDAPVHGTFNHGVGTFFGNDVFEGRPIRIRFLWSRMQARSARWEQAFSADGGATWETNWIMEFDRI